ncbi:MAG TPA: hypothetical protein VNO23_14380, partial [Candidatus Binatia bacterium]|nr:hypothetical protein [Candidatus Binatia bacterium]
LLALLLLLLPALAAPVLAEPVVRFGARVLLATDGPPPAGLPRNPPGRDERLERFLPRLRQLFRYREYTSVERFRAEVPVGTTQRWPVPGDRHLEVTPESVTGNAVRLRVRLLRGSTAELNALIQAASGNPAVIGGPRHGEGVLIIIVWANPNP